MGAGFSCALALGRHTPAKINAEEIAKNLAPEGMGHFSLRFLNREGFGLTA
jgi:hypothetical protein